MTLLAHDILYINIMRDKCVRITSLCLRSFFSTPNGSFFGIFLSTVTAIVRIHFSEWKLAGEFWVRDTFWSTHQKRHLLAEMFVPA